MPKLYVVMCLLLASFGLSGCIALAAAGGGYVLADETKETDGKFDPLEKVRGKEDSSN